MITITNPDVFVAVAESKWVDMTICEHGSLGQSTDVRVLWSGPMFYRFALAMAQVADELNATAVESGDAA